MGCTFGRPCSSSSAAHRHLHETSCSIVGCDTKNRTRTSGNLARNLRIATQQTGQKLADRQSSAGSMSDSLSDSDWARIQSVSSSSEEPVCVNDDGPISGRSFASPTSTLEKSITATMNSMFPPRESVNSGLPQAATLSSSSLPSIWSLTSPNLVGPMPSFPESGESSSASSSSSASPSKVVPAKADSVFTRVHSPQVQMAKMRLERHHSDGGGGARRKTISHSKLRKTASCNDSWLAEIEDELGLNHLPAITEVPSEQKAATNRVPFDEPKNSKKTSVSWLSSMKHLRPVSKVRPLSTDMLAASKLPIILEDLDINSASTSKEIVDPNFGRLDVVEAKDADMELSVRMYVASMTELIELEETIDPRDLPLLRNIAIDPNSPLLVKYVQSQNSKDNCTPEANISSNSSNINNNPNINSHNNNNTMTKGSTEEAAKVFKPVLVEQDVI